jgi:hypothetical protein
MFVLLGRRWDPSLGADGEARWPVVSVNNSW